VKAEPSGEEEKSDPEEAVDWMQKHQPDDDELRRFRAEAEELITRPDS
jgi:hypothetical protein